MSSARNLALIGALITLAVPTAASAQATRTWISGSGDDSMPCNFDSPCKTFAGAISKTAPGGEINPRDAGGFGGLTITKSLTIRSVGLLAGALVAGTNDFVVNALATDSVTIDGLDMNGIGTGAPVSLSGLKVITAGTVRIVNSEIYRFKSGITFVPTTSNARLIVDNVQIFDNNIGIIVAPGNASAAGASVIVQNSRIDNNTCGAVVTSHGTNASTPDASTNCGAATAASGIAQPTTLRIFDSTIANNTTGVLADGSGQAVIVNSILTGNGTALSSTDGGQLSSFGGNDIVGNGTDGSFGATSNTKGFMGPQGATGVQGPKGDTGTAGATGATGPQGVAGPRGKRGLPGKVELVTCHRVKKRQRCTTRLVTKPVRFTTSGKPKLLHATLTRAGRVYARGAARVTQRAVAVSLRTSAPLRPGRYVVKLWSGKRLVARRVVVV